MNRSNNIFRRSTTIPQKVNRQLWIGEGIVILHLSRTKLGYNFLGFQGCFFTYLISSWISQHLLDKARFAYRQKQREFYNAIRHSTADLILPPNTQNNLGYIMNSNETFSLQLALVRPSPERGTLRTQIRQRYCCGKNVCATTGKRPPFCLFLIKKWKN